MHRQVRHEHWSTTPLELKRLLHHGRGRRRCDLPAPVRMAVAMLVLRTTGGMSGCVLARIE
jgi:hypothetical protein